MTALKRINKKAVYGVSMLLSAVLGFFFATSKKYQSDILSIITEAPLSSIERAYATDGCGSADCSAGCSSDGTTTGPGGASVDLNFN